MPNYVYKARDRTGKLTRGAMAAANKEELVDKLRKMGCMAVQVTEALPGVKVGSLVERMQPIRAEEMIMFYVQLSNMISAGIPILLSLNTLGKQIENKKLKEVIDSVSRSIEAGDNFSQALARYPRVFPDLFVNMMKAGEASGELDRVLSRYAEYFERQENLRQKIKAALFYPMILLFAGIAVTLFIITFIIPQFVDLFVRVGITLPIPTVILFKVGTWIKHFWHSALFLIIFIWVGTGFYARTKKGRFNFDRARLKIPVLGALHRKAAVSRFARTLGTLTGSAVPILESLDITKEVVGNEVLALAVETARNSVEKGEKISEPLKVSGEFPDDCVQMISVGEESGNLEGMLNKVADFYDMSVGYAIKKLTGALEPIFLIVMGSLVGFIMASMLMPVFDMIKILRY